MKSGFNGRAFQSTTLAEKDEQGNWKITTSMVEKIRFDDSSEWLSEEISATCTHENFETAYGVSMNSVLEQFNDRVSESDGVGLFSKEVYGDTEEQQEAVSTQTPVDTEGN